MSQENEILAHFKKYQSFSELTSTMLVEENPHFEHGRLEITLNFKDELKNLTSYLGTNPEVWEE